MNTITKSERRPGREEPAPPRGYLSPDVNITELKEEYVLEAEMPGVSKDGLEVLLEGNELTIVGRRRDEPPKDARLLYRESSPRDFRRVFVLDPTIDTSKIEARMEQGVLTLRLPKAEKVKPRRVTVS